MNITSTNSRNGKTLSALKPSVGEMRRDLESELDTKYDENSLKLDEGEIGYDDFRVQNRELESIDPRVSERKLGNFKRGLRLATGFVAGAALGYQGGTTGAIATGISAGTGNFITHGYHFDNTGERVMETIGSTLIGAACGVFGGWFGALAGGISGAIMVNTLPLLKKSD